MPEFASTPSSHEFSGYPENYTGRLTEITPQMQADLGELMHVLNAEYDGAPIPEEVLRPYIEMPTRALIVAIRGGEVVGTISASEGAELFAGNYVFTGSLVVREDWRGLREDEGDRSIYQQMLEAVEAFGRERGATKMFCAISPTNEHSKAAHLRESYRETGAGFWEKPIPPPE